MIPWLSLKMPNCFLQISNLGLLLKDFWISLIQIISASTMMSWAADSLGEEISFLSDDFMVLTNLRTRAVTISSLCRSVKSSSLMICAIPQGSVVARNKDGVWYFTFSYAFTSKKHSSGMCVLLNTLLVSSVTHVNHLGASFQRGHFESSARLDPLEWISAGLSLPLQCCHLLAGTRVLISFTRFRANCFHSLSSPLIQNNVTLESVQQVIIAIVSSSSKASLTCVISLAGT